MLFILPVYGRKGNRMQNESQGVLHNSMTGETIIVLKPSSVNKGSNFQFEDRVKRGIGKPPPLHIHPNQTECFTVQQGQARLMVNKHWQILNKGDSYTVPAGVTHTFEPIGDEELVLHIVFEPALDIETFFRSLAQASSDGKSIILQIALLNQELASKFYLGGIPKRLQDVLYIVLAIPARWLNYQIIGR